MIAYRFAEEGRQGEVRGGRDRAKEKRRHEGGEERRERRGGGQRRGEERGGNREDTKEQYYFYSPETLATINCCFSISLVPMTTVLDSDACISHNNTHAL